MADADDAANPTCTRWSKARENGRLEDEAVAHLALRACADVAGVPEATARCARTILLEPVTAPPRWARSPKASDRAGRSRRLRRIARSPAVAASCRRGAGDVRQCGIVPYEEGKGLLLAAEAPHALGSRMGGWSIRRFVLVSTARWPVEPPAPPEITILSWPLDDDDDHLARLLRRFPRATYALTADVALRLVSDRDRAIAATSGGATFAVQRGAVEAAKRAWELPQAALAAFTWIGAADNDVRNVVEYSKTGCGSKPDLTGLSSGEHFEGRVTDLTDGSPSTRLAPGATRAAGPTASRAARA